MKISVLASGSKGNCAILDDGGSKIMIDCGLKFTDIITNKSFGKFSDYEYLLLTHMHTDHSMSLKDFEDSGIETITTNNSVNTLYKGDNWLVQPFEVPHNIKCYSYLIKSTRSNLRLLWASDLNDLPKVENRDVYCIECNYDEETICDKIGKGIGTKSQFQNHFSLEQLVSYLEELKTRPKLLVLLHKSNEGNLNEQKALEKLSSLADRVLIANKNMEIEI